MTFWNTPRDLPSLYARTVLVPTRNDNAGVYSGRRTWKNHGRYAELAFNPLWCPVQRTLTKAMPPHPPSVRVQWSHAGPWSAMAYYCRVRIFFFFPVPSSPGPVTIIEHITGIGTHHLRTRNVRWYRGKDVTVHVYWRLEQPISRCVQISKRFLFFASKKCTRAIIVTHYNYDAWPSGETTTASRIH